MSDSTVGADGPVGRDRRIGHIDEEIAAYAAHTSAGDSEIPGTRYGSEGLAVVYEPRVRQLLDLKSEGYTYAEWRWDLVQGHNRWHGVPDYEVPGH